MQLHTFKARSLSEALHLVRQTLGPDASVLHTRDATSPLARLLGGRLIEVIASAELSAPSRMPDDETARIPAAELQDFRRKMRHDVAVAQQTEASLVEELAATHDRVGLSSLPGAGAIADRLRRAGVSRATARRWLDQLAAEMACDPDCHTDRVLERLHQIIAADVAQHLFH